MINLWGTERSTLHATYVKKVYRYLKQKCEVADFERQLVSGYVTDAYGYDRKSKIWYLCEIKVNDSDLQKAPKQIRDTAFHFPKTPFYHKGDTIIPVIAFPARLQKELIKLNTWDSLCSICKMMKEAIWVVEQSTVREIMNPKTKVIKAKSTATKAVKTKRPKTKATKTRTARTKKIAKPKKSSAESYKHKTLSAKKTKRNT